MSNADLETAIEAAWDNRDSISAATQGETRDAVETALGAMDSGTLRVAERGADGTWHVNQWAKKAVLLSFRLNDMAPIARQFLEHDTLPAIDAIAQVQATEIVRGFRRGDTLQNAAACLNKRDIHPGFRGNRGGFKADISAADHKCRASRANSCLHPIRIRQSAHIVYSAELSGNLRRQGNGAGTRGQNQPVIGSLCAVGQVHCA